MLRGIYDAYFLYRTTSEKRLSTPARWAAVQLGLAKRRLSLLLMMLEYKQKESKVITLRRNP